MSVNHENTTDRLHWTAMCYLLDELSADECAAFESQIENDQSAREALAAAVELRERLAGGMEIASPVAPLAPAPSSGWRAPAITAFAVAASALVLAALAGGFLVDSRPAPQPSEIVSTDTAEDARLLMELMDEFNSPDLPLENEEPPVIAAAEIGEEVPEWLYSAVSSEFASEPKTESLEN